MIKLIVFDYDGVIVDSFPSIHKTYMDICDGLGLTCPTDIEEFRNIYGYNFIELRKRLGIITQQDKERSEELYRERHPLHQSELFDGITNVIATLSEIYTLVLVTANYTQFAQESLDEKNLLKYFSLVAGKDDNESKLLKKSDKISDIMKQYNTTTEEVISIGDRNIDYDIATELGIQNFILASYGWGCDVSKIGSNAIIADSPKEIIQAVKTISEK